MIRRAESGDIKRVYEIEKMSFDNPWPQNEFLPYLDGGHEKFIVSDNDGVDGFIIYSLIAGEAEVFDLAVAAESRGRGIGKALMEEMLSQADAAFLEVRKDNAPAIGLYERCGFKVTGERKKYYSDGEDALLMTWNR
ncbi:MAG: ribosomal protein S18-alanine N-acetyltransferase [Clostridia bacterium]